MSLLNREPRHKLAALLTVLSFLAACGGPEVREPADGSRPDVVVILIDTLAATSTVFRRAYSTSSWTAPATASLFTSKYPTQHGVTSGFFATRAMQERVAESGTAQQSVNAIAPSLKTLPELFQAAGYRTFGVAANVNLGDAMGFTRGFDRFQQLHELHMGSAGSAEDIEAQLATWESEIQAQPAFVYLHFNDVHNPYTRHKPWYDKKDDPLDDARAAYDSEIRAVDESLRRIFDRFGWLSETSPTVVSVVSDHGEEFQEHGGRFHKLSLYRELMQVVTILRVPEGGGQEVDVNVTWSTSCRPCSTWPVCRRPKGSKVNRWRLSTATIARCRPSSKATCT